jgi:hypothetical protein
MNIPDFIIQIILDDLSSGKGYMCESISGSNLKSLIPFMSDSVEKCCKDNKVYGDIKLDVKVLYHMRIVAHHQMLSNALNIRSFLTGNSLLENSIEMIKEM